MVKHIISSELFESLKTLAICIQSEKRLFHCITERIILASISNVFPEEWWKPFAFSQIVIHTKRNILYPILFSDSNVKSFILLLIRVRVQPLPPILENSLFVGEVEIYSLKWRSGIRLWLVSFSTFPNPIYQKESSEQSLTIRYCMLLFNNSQLGKAECFFCFVMTLCGCISRHSDFVVESSGSLIVGDE